MIVIRDKKLDKYNLAGTTDILTAAFKDDPLYQAIFQNERELRRYLKLMLDYFNENGEIHTAVVNDEIVGVSIWNFKGTPFFSIRNALTSGMFGEIFKFLMITQVKSLIKLKNEGLITERYHYKREHHYLFMIGSVKKGAGRLLMEYAIGKFSECPIYLENSNIKDNKIFYERLEFHSIKTIDVMGISVDLLTNGKRELL
ncbi:hypothetical protein GH810_15370 [Acetobacterium paludosum]|uniref:Uncharacterized protein n=1 Tax=Acetobacterium paludosum TaxID=52693 RepID=A0A923HZW6_9FIRM|nr:hypothetical protein [Acetobacterium paludosum]MBC3889689.1 hypothetical protein [Acetobacterium paludosum]